ncbi:MAG: T9SS type A sorting domain-containing protein [Bacteroidia bacterium]|nr:T9SS type A sorting domain-containing protein [Bacteroidia bacterium]
MKIKVLLLAGIYLNMNVAFAQTSVSRLVLIEQFTNSGCSICASHDHWISDFTDNNPSAAVEISYHTSFPYYDSMYFENPAESNARTALYGVPGVPWSVIDGNFYSNATSSLNSAITSTVTARQSNAPAYSISTSGTSLLANNLSGQFIFESIDAANISKNLVAHVVIVEKNVLKNSYAASPGTNTQTVYKNVMRKMIPNVSGTVLLNKNLNGKDTVVLNWNLLHIKNPNEVAVVCFVQDSSSKEILQAATFDVVSTDISKLQFNGQLFSVFPNPSSGVVYISVNSAVEKETQLEFITFDGRIIKTEHLILSDKPKLVSIYGMSPGVYLLRLKDSAGNCSVKKILIDQ